MNAFGVPNRGRCLVIGILNVTPDSFSDGGLHLEVRAAVKHGLAMPPDGADIVDVGGESTRPGADRTPEAAELSLILPVVSELAAAGIPISVRMVGGQRGARGEEIGYGLQPHTGDRGDVDQNATEMRGLSWKCLADSRFR